MYSQVCYDNAKISGLCECRAWNDPQSIKVNGFLNININARGGIRMAYRLYIQAAPAIRRNWQKQFLRHVPVKRKKV